MGWHGAHDVALSAIVEVSPPLYVPLSPPVSVHMSVSLNARVCMCVKECVCVSERDGAGILLLFSQGHAFFLASKPP